ALRERRGRSGKASRHGDGGGHQLLRARVVALQLRGARGVEEERRLPLRIARGGGAAYVRLLGRRVLLVAEVGAPEVERVLVAVRREGEDGDGAIEVAVALQRVAEERQLRGVHAVEKVGTVERAA